LRADPVQLPSDAVTAERDRAAIWGLPPEVSLLWQCWDQDEVIVFNRGSGQTHLLDAFSAAVLRRIEASPATISDLARYFARSLELDEGVLSERVGAVCTRFDELGLAEPTPP
jgi:PqqD family protein of HPr-rel-A system